VRAKKVNTVQLIVTPQKAEANMDDLGRHGTMALERRQKMMRYLIEEPGPVNVSWVYAHSGGNLADLRVLAEKGLVGLGESEVWRDPLEDLEVRVSQAPELTREQRVCLDEILAGLEEAAAGRTPPPYLLHGVTGSGKTEVYLCAVAAVLRMGKRALVLQPEIALTPQAVRRFMARFPGQVGLIHSRLSAGERYDTWRRARGGELDLIVGPRSALFAPLPDIGLIILDESHDDSYYQSEPPFYHARRAAIQYARLCGAVCLMGSATPDVTSTYYAAQKKWRYLRLPARIMAHRAVIQSQARRFGWTPRYKPLEGQADTIELPPVEVIDMRAELKAGNRSIFSRALQTELSSVLNHNQQAILFLNRRGTATYVFCRDCGHVMRCPNCDLPLTYHGSQNALTCHYCAYHRGVPKTCPSCKSSRIRHYGTGTERVEEEVLSLFPKARTLRWDYETTRKKGAHDAILTHFHAHRADILVGTQMLAKGLDLPLVTLVGVVLADVGLNLPDYSAPERAFQVLTQVAGRAGRSPLGGQVVLQTFEPEHYVIQAAKQHSYRAFYQKELAYRRELGYPPFANILRLEYRHLEEAKAEAAALKMAADLRTWIQNEGRHSTEIIGPVPPFFARLSGYYRWQIVLRGPDPAGLLRGRRLSEWRIEVNPPSLL
jgi:primosomal protein N' (replication factor Y)